MNGDVDMEQAATSEDPPPRLIDVDDIPTVAAKRSRRRRGSSFPVRRGQHGHRGTRHVRIGDRPMPCAQLRRGSDMGGCPCQPICLIPMKWWKPTAAWNEGSATNFPIAWSGQSDRATVSRMARVQPRPGDTCDSCEQVLTADDIAESGDFEDCERLSSGTLV